MSEDLNTNSTIEHISLVTLLESLFRVRRIVSAQLGTAASTLISCGNLSQYKQKFQLNEL